MKLFCFAFQVSVRQQGLTHDSSKQDAADVEVEQHEAPGTATRDTFFGDATEKPVKGEARVITEFQIFS